MKSNYNPEIHKGQMPVRVLEPNLLAWFHELPDNFSALIKDEIVYSDLQKAILLRSPNTKIECVAEINPEHQVVLYENFNQYLWCISYALFGLFDKGVVLPSYNKSYSGFIDPLNPALVESFHFLQTGLDLCDRFIPPCTFLDLDNPEEYFFHNKDIVGIVNGIYVPALGYILAHEFAYQYLGHVDMPEQLIEHEIAADKCAIEFIKPTFSGKAGRANQIGIVSALCSIALLDRELDGGTAHPNILSRLENALSSFTLSNNDEIWGYAAVALVIWHQYYYKTNLEMPRSVESYFELFDKTRNAIKKKFEVST